MYFASYATDGFDGNAYWQVRHKLKKNKNKAVNDDGTIWTFF